MATTSKQAVELLREMLNKSSSDVVTLKWGEFYDVICRERMGTEYMDDVVKKSRDAGLNVAYGNATVLVAKDYLFCPKK